MECVGRGDPTYGAAKRATLGERSLCEQTIEDDDFTRDSVPSSEVYVLLDREACQIKIGYSAKDTAGRIRSHERIRGRKLELLGTMKGTRLLEYALHRRFKPYRREANEWYSSEIIGELAPLLAA